jgi:DNA-binding SARP family transcriptional activator
MSIRVDLLGTFRVRVGPDVVPDDAWRRRKAAAVVKLLALASGHRMHREQMMDMLWPDLDPPAAAANLRKAVHYARAALEAACPGAGEHVVTAGDHVALRSCEGELAVDVDQFRSRLSAARRTGDVDGYRRALDLYEGELLPEDLYEEWAVGARGQLSLDFLSGMTEMAHLLEKDGDLRGAIEAVRRLVAADPTGEDGNAALMRLYALAGRRGEALRHYEHFCGVLDRELGAAPAPTTQRLRDEIRTLSVSGRTAGELVAQGLLRRSCRHPSGTHPRCRTGHRDRGVLPRTRW